MTTAYKVVKVINNERFSMNAPGGFCMKYLVGEEVKAKIGGFFVFCSLPEAVYFAKGERSWHREPIEVWRCEIGDRRMPPVEIPYTDDDEELANFWNGEELEEDQLHGVPSGTMLTDTVKLLEKVCPA